MNSQMPYTLGYLYRFESIAWQVHGRSNISLMKKSGNFKIQVIP